MKAEEIIRGTKVVPIKKSVGNELSSSMVWARVKDEQGFMYIKGYTMVPYYFNGKKKIVICTKYDDYHGGDHFLPEDLIPYGTGLNNQGMVDLLHGRDT